MIDFDDFVASLQDNKQHTFGDTYYFPYRKQMPLTVVKLISNNGISHDVLCQIDSGADGSSVFEKHVRKIKHLRGDTINISSSTGEAL